MSAHPSVVFIAAICVNFNFYFVLCLCVKFSKTGLWNVTLLINAQKTCSECENEVV